MPALIIKRAIQAAMQIEIAFRAGVPKSYLGGINYGTCASMTNSQKRHIVYSKLRGLKPDFANKA